MINPTVTKDTAYASFVSQKCTLFPLLLFLCLSKEAVWKAKSQGQQKFVYICLANVPHILMALICIYIYLCLNAHTEKYVWKHTLFTYIYTCIHSIFQVRVLLTHGFFTSLLPPFLPLRVSFKRGRVRHTEGQFLANTCLYTFCVFYMSICSTCKWQ